VIRDSKGVVLSLPPIINGEHSKVTLATKNIFIECTATDITKAETVLDILVTMLSEHCAKPYDTEATKVIYEATKETKVYPLLEYKLETVDVNQANKIVGIE
jgi:phenylalanyl-tRNA synthetase beta chain